MMSHQDNNNKWGCTLTANNESRFSSVEDDRCVADKVNKDNRMPRDGQLQQYNNSTPQTRGTRRKKMRDKENRKASLLKCVQTTKHPEGNTTAEKGSPYYRNFPKSQRRNIHDTDSDSHASAELQNSDIICYSNSILQVIASCTHLTKFFLSPPSKDHQCFTLYYEFANVIHSMITGGPDVVNPYTFVEIFKSNHKILMQMNVRTYCDIYCDIGVLSYCSVMLDCHIVVLLY
jgi:hypothetical protein